MDAWMISRQELKHDLQDIFSGLSNLQYQFDWFISDHDLWYSENCPDEVKKRWQWTGLLMSGQELTEYLVAGYVYFGLGAVLSAVPPGTKPEQVWDYLPGWEVDFDSPDYQYQTPLTQLELICYDGYAWVIVCNSELSERIRQDLPQACRAKDFYNR